MTDRLPLRKVPLGESDAFIAMTARLAAEVFKTAGWQWYTGTSDCVIPDAARLALALRRHLAEVRASLDEIDEEDRCSWTGSGRLEVHHREGSLVVMLDLGHLSLVDWATVEAEEIEQGRGTGKATLNAMKAAVAARTKQP